LLIVKTLAKKGHTVFATMRGVGGKNAGAANELRSWAESEKVKVHTLELDVTNQGSVDRAIKQALDTAGHLDVVVNNAGLGAASHTETFTPEQATALFDVNVVGIQRVNRAVLPSMRERHSGLLIHISSGLGRFVIPCLGLYGATKFAVESLAETYRYELAPTGVDSVIVQPGAFGTDFGKNSLQPADAGRAAGYGEGANLTQMLFANMSKMFEGPNAPNPQLVADAVAKLIDTPVGQRPLRTVVAPTQAQGIEACNQVAAQVQQTTFEHMGLKHLLQPKTK
jgi:NAD(P)-dependent dehydrogenase (short-subunit alcohol dehydrogenase family)